MNYLSVNNLTKSYGDKLLFKNINFGLDKGDKTALIAKNGAGKSTLLKIIAGNEPFDNGKVVLRKGINIGYLAQDPVLNNELTIEELLKSSGGKILTAIREYENALKYHTEKATKQAELRLEKATANIDRLEAWDYERRLKQILTKFNITNQKQKISTLSGGQRKRLALALTLLDNPELLLLDEPTNHLDIEMIEWLEKFLQQSNITLLMITHDRYFLDNVCNNIFELSDEILYTHKGNYSYYLEKKAEREDVKNVEIEKAKRLMKKELEWIRRQPKARTTKSKARIDAFNDIQTRASAGTKEQELVLSTISKRLGNKILELRKVTKRYGDIKIVTDFDYTFKKNEKIGIIGNNGTGKSTLLNMITGKIKPDKGTITIGDTVEFGYYSQEGLPVYRDDLKVIEVVKDIAEIIHTGKNQSMTASQFLNYFMFPPSQQNDYVSKLSGGERRRLYLLTVLMKNPNFLILDEPTNDLDLMTLYKLEEFLENFKGCLLIVSHDRYFLDKLSDHIFIFEGNGHIKDFYGKYSEYKKETIQSGKDNKVKEKKILEKPQGLKKKLSYKEQKEYYELEIEIEQLEKEKSNLETLINSGITDFNKLQELSMSIENIINKIDEKTLRWMELEELKERLKENNS
jgi:ATP-binding cassette subfamily F protein uup